MWRGEGGSFAREIYKKYIKNIYKGPKFTFILKLYLSEPSIRNSLPCSRKLLTCCVAAYSADLVNYLNCYCYCTEVCYRQQALFQERGRWGGGGTLISK